MGVAGPGIVGQEIIAVEPAQPFRGGDPDIALFVLENTGHIAVGQPLLYGKTFDLDLWWAGRLSTEVCRRPNRE